jgi:DnaJ-class molecular chaperone
MRRVVDQHKPDRAGDNCHYACPGCDGAGMIDEGTDDEQQCPTCGGSGVVPGDDDDDDEGDGEVIRTEPRVAATPAR